MTISAKVIADSISKEGKRLLSFEIQCHRWILAEINTHRALSRNYRSSRAVPFAKLLAEVRKNPALPVTWMKNRPGMVATEPMTNEEAGLAESLWRDSARAAADKAEFINNMTNLHKQWVNRILEPYLYTHGVISGTEWNNFFALRRAPDAQPEFKELADAMFAAQRLSVPHELLPGEWHLPYVSAEEQQDGYFGLTGYRAIDFMIKLSVARVARVSVKPFDYAHINVEKDLELHGRLLDQKHMSPFEHQATPDKMIDTGCFGVHDWENRHQHGNLVGFRQYRKLIQDEFVPG